ncbi:MAG TPA: NAD-dependent succinate-semialdehyde dehydrogenase [Caulobacteraceae bacterium]
MSDYPELAMYIDGEWVGVGHRRVHHVLNPASGQTLGELPLADAADLDRALDAAARGFKLWRATPANDRARVLKKAADLMRERVEHIARIATQEEGKTLGESRMETNVTANWLEFAGEEAKRAYGRVLVRPSGQRHMVLKEPVGPVAAFAPWNFPVGNPGRKLAAPIAAGCSVILKPAEESPNSALEVLRALIDAGLPAGVAQIVFGVPDEVSRHLLASPVIRKLSFTGSVPVGKHLMKLAAERMLRTTMELGGHGPVIVFDDADIDQALSIIAPHKYRNAGQVCVSPTRFYVQEPVYERFVKGFTEIAESLVVGDGLDPASKMGPMANPRRLDAMEALIGDARANGAEVLTGGERMGNQGFFWRPTVIRDAPDTSRIMNEEPFGPVAIMNPFKDFDDAVEKANRLPYGLAAYAFTQSSKRAMLISDAIEAGMVGVNNVQIAGADAPFGGVKESGHGSEDGPEGVDACRVIKSVSMA